MSSLSPVIIADCVLYNADCAEVMPNLRKMDFLLTDPPYGLGRKLRGGGGCKIWKSSLKKMDEWDMFAPHGLVNQAVSLCAKSIVWGGNYFSLPPSRNFLVWDKGMTMKNRSFAECEQAWCSWDGNARIYNLGMPTHCEKEVKQHPTQKPLALMQWCLSYANNGATVFDPFMGSGTTGVACVLEGKKFIGIERDKEYFAVAVDRIQKALRHSPLPLYIPQNIDY